MPTLNAATTLEQAQDFATNWAAADIVILNGATVLVTHSVTSWNAANSGSDGTATAVVASAGAATITGTGTQTADGAELRSGTEVIVLAVGTDITLTTTTFINGETSTVTSLVITFPAS